MSEGSVPSCVRCGAPLPIDPTAATVGCTSCGAEHRIDDALRARMLAYVGGHAAAGKAEVRARWIAVFNENNRRAAVPVLVGAVGVALVVVLWIGLGIAGQVSAPLVAGSVALSWLLIAVLGLGFRVAFAMPRPQDLARFAPVRCAGCGGVSAFAAGAPVAACGYCGGRRLVPMRVAQAALEEARHEARAAAMQQASTFDRAARAGDRWVVPLVLLTLAAVLVGGPLLVAVELLWLHAYWPIPALLGLPALVLAVGLEAAWFGAVFRRTLRARDELERIVAAHGEREALGHRGAGLSPPRPAQPWDAVRWTAFAEGPDGALWLHDGSLVLRHGVAAGAPRPPAAAAPFAPIAAILSRPLGPREPLAALFWDAARSAWLTRGGVMLGAKYVEALRTIPGLELAPAGREDPVLLVRDGTLAGALMPLRP